MTAIKENLKGKINGYAKCIKNKTKIITIGLFMGGLLISNNVFAGNPADLTYDYRQTPFQYYKLTFNQDKDKGALASIPFGDQKENSASIFGLIDDDNSLKLLQGGIATKKGPLNLGLQGTWNDKNSKITTSIDISEENGNFALAALIDLKDLEKTQLGIRTKLLEGLTAYFKTPLKESEPMLGIGYKFPKSIALDLAYEPKKETYLTRLSKKFKTHFGIIKPELRATYNGDEQFYALCIGFIPK